MKNSLRMVALATLSISLSSIADDGLNTVTGAQAAAVFAKLSANEAADLGLAKQTGLCVVSQPLGGSYKYKASFFNAAMTPKLQIKYFGWRSSYNTQSVQMLQAAQQQASFLQKLNDIFLFPQAHAAINLSTIALAAYTQAPALAYALPTYVSLATAKEALGYWIKTNVANGNCKNVAVDSFTLSMGTTNLPTFYRAPDNSIVCESEYFARKVRLPNTCVLMPVKKFLAKEVCLQFYKIATKKSARLAQAAPATGTGVATGTGTGTGVATGTGTVTSTGVVFGKYASISQALAVDAVFTANPELVAVANNAIYPRFEDTLSEAQLIRLDSLIAAPNKATYWAGLDAAARAELVGLTFANFNAKANTSANLQFSSDINSALTAIQGNIAAYVEANPTLQVSLVAIAPKHIIATELSAQLAPYTSIIGSAFNYELACPMEAAHAAFQTF
jgi:hypothetical protein